MPIDQFETVILSGSSIQSPSSGLADDLDVHLISLFMSKVCSSNNAQIAVGFLAFLPSMVTKSGSSNEDSGLILTCQAISYAFIANDFGTSESRSRRSLAYGKALKVTNAALNDPVSSVKDETLMTVWLLSLYEVLDLGRNQWNPF